MSQQKQRIAIYDLDRTITQKPTYSHFLLRSAWRIAPLRLIGAPAMPVLMLAYRFGLMSRDRLKERLWSLLLGRTDAGRLDAAVADFVRCTVARNVRPGARAQIERDRPGGTLLVLATAAHELYAQPISKALGLDAVVATRAFLAGDGRIGPGLAGDNCYGAAKLAALQLFLQKRMIAREAAHITFYSDSSSDEPIFDWSDRPVAVNPSRKLARLAAARGWPVADWGGAESRALVD
jgi:HAD superfamily phosphoserine phosphatase-like hydrolase